MLNYFQYHVIPIGIEESPYAFSLSKCTYSDHKQSEIAVPMYFARLTEVMRPQITVRIAAPCAFIHVVAFY